MSIINTAFDVKGGVLVKYRGKGGNVIIPAGITTIGAQAFFNCYNVNSITIPDSVKRIESSAFEFCSGLMSVHIPKSVTFIDGAVFGGCSKLQSITVDAKNSAYKSIDGNLYTKDGKYLLQYALGKKDARFNIPAEVTNIYYFAFWGNTTLAHIQANDKTGYFVTKYGNLYSEYGKKLFQYAPAKSGKAYIVEDDVESIGDSGFAWAVNLEKIYLPNGLKVIGHNSFQNCTSLTEIYVPRNVTEIGANAFWNCPNLKKVYNLSKLNIQKGADTFGYVAKYADQVYLNQSRNPDFQVFDRKLVSYVGSGSAIRIPIGVTEISKYAFFACKTVTSVHIPDTVKIIEPHSFEHCDNLKSINIPASVEKINTPVFIGCYNLINITVDAGNKYYTTIDGNIYSKDGTKLIQYALGKQDTKFVLPKKVTGISVGAFFGNITLKEIQACDPMGYFVTKDGNLYCNYGKQLLQYASGKRATEFKVPEGVEVLGMGSVTMCLNLKRVILPSTLVKIQSAAFVNSIHLEEIVLPPSLKVIEDEAFLGCTNLTTIYNYSAINIVKGSFDNGMIGKEAKKIYVRK